jgi:peptide/nickel transport system substrate-binding protein
MTLMVESKKRIACVLFLVLIAVLLPVRSGGAVPQSTPRSGGSLRFGLSTDIQSLNPFQRTSSVTKSVVSISFESLLAFDRNGALKPALATSWEASKDGLQYTLRLRKGVQFHNGKELTAQDVIWSMEYALDPKNSAYGRDGLSPVASLSTPDPLAVRVTLKASFVPFLSRISNIQGFPIVPQGSVPPGREKMNLYPPGTGPFVMADYKPNQLIAFKRFDQYWQKGLPYLQEILFRPNEDETVRFTALRAGDVDIVDVIPYEQAARIQKGEIKGFGTERAVAIGYRAVLFNTEQPPFNNVKVRQAVAYAIDKEKILDALAWGLGFVSDQKMLKGSPWFVPLSERKRDLEKTKALLREAGYPDRVKVKFHMQKGRETEAQLLQSQLREAGIDLELEVMDFAKHQNDQREGSYVAATLGGGAAIDPDLTYYESYHTEAGARKINNFARYSNPRVDKLLEQGRTEVDFQKRYRIYKEFVEIIHEEVPQIPLGFRPQFFAFHGYVKGFEIDPNSFFFYGTGGLGMTWLDR